MKIYFEPSHYHKEKRAYLADILRPFINMRTLEENVKIYGKQIAQYEIMSNPADADLCILTMTWGYYFETGQFEKARAFIRQARASGKPTAIWQNGDFSIRAPEEDVWLFQCGGLRATRSPHQFGQSVFIGDPLIELSMSEIKVRTRHPRPVVGFCGQAERTFAHAVSTSLRFGLHNLKSAMGVTPYDPLPLCPLPTRLRSQALDQLERNSNIQTNFIKRKKYRAGARTPEDQKISRHAFWQNMIESDYIVCARGTGNFSVRLYETLAMGRIPIFIDTGCVLPYEHNIDWKEYCVWVDASELDTLPQKALEFHARFNDADFIEHQKRCRILWEERLSFSGFFKHFSEHFS